MKTNIIVNHINDFSSVYHAIPKHLEVEAITSSPEIYSYLNSIDIKCIYIESPRLCAKTIWNESTAFAKSTSELIHGAANFEHCDSRHWMTWDLCWMHRLAKIHDLISEAIAEKYPERSFLIPKPEAPYTYGQHSFVPAICHALKYRKSGLNFSLVSFETHTSTDIIPNLDILSKYIDRTTDYGLVNFSTCFYDLNKFEQMARSSRYDNIYLNSPKYDPPGISIPQSGLLPFPENYFKEFNPQISRIYNLLFPNILDIIPDEQSAKLISINFSKEYIKKYIFFVELKKLLLRKMPKKIFTSEHESSYTAPLLAIAEQLNIETHIVPHAKTFGYEIPAKPRNNLTIHAHPSQGTLIRNFDGDVLNHKYTEFALEQRGILPRKDVGDNAFTVGVLQTGTSANGAPNTIASRIAKFTLMLAKHLSNISGQVIVRHRTNQNLTGLFQLEYSESNIIFEDQSKEPLEAFINKLDLAVSIGVPTSAIYPALAVGVPAIHILTHELSTPEQGTIDPTLIPQLHIEAALETITRMSINKNLRMELTKSQSETYKARINSEFQDSQESTTHQH